MPWQGWGIHVDIQAPPGATDEVTAWQDLKFNPLGLYDLRRRLGVLRDQRGTFVQHQHRFLASDIAWFVAGSHDDGNHQTESNSFHPMFFEARLHTTNAQERQVFSKKSRDLLFDTVCTCHLFLC
jgi:hypothetical protein